EVRAPPAGSRGAARGCGRDPARRARAWTSPTAAARAKAATLGRREGGVRGALELRDDLPALVEEPRGGLTADEPHRAQPDLATQPAQAAEIPIGEEARERKQHRKDDRPQGTHQPPHQPDLEPPEEWDRHDAREKARGGVVRLLAGKPVADDARDEVGEPVHEHAVEEDRQPETGPGAALETSAQARWA